MYVIILFNMAAQITTSFNIYQPEYISYGLKIGIRETSDLKYRNKLGVKVYLDNAVVGNIEIDIFEKNKVYDLELGNVIKEYINKSEPLPFNGSRAGVVSDNVKNIKLVPYSKSREFTDNYWTILNGTDKELYAQRGINKVLYLEGDNSPQDPKGSTIFDKLPGAYQMDIPHNSYKYLYKALWHDQFNYARLTGNWTLYKPDGSSMGGGVIDINAIDNEDITGYFNIGSYYNSNFTKAAKLTLSFNEVVINRGSGDVVAVTETWNITVNFTCSQEYDFSSTLIYLDNTFNWNSISFNIKNETSLTRSNNSIESYDHTITDYNLQVRRTFNLKSNYLSKSEAKEAILLGTTSRVYLMTDSNHNINSARLLNQIVPLLSPSNMGLLQIEAQVELSNLIPTA